MGTSFQTARARARAPEILDFAATLGAAVLLDPTGEPVLTSGEEDAVLRLLEAGSTRREATFAGGWQLRVSAAADVPPLAVARRFWAAVHLFTLALADRDPPDGHGEGGGPAPAEVAAARIRARAG